MLTTEELEKKLKISENTCIHCPTLELAKQVLNIFNQLCLKWCSGNSYIRYTNWDSFKENTVYYPFDGKISSLISAHLAGYKIIKAKEFIALHTEEEKFNLENYEPKGQLIGFPKEIIARMLECQEEQGNPRDVSVFERLSAALQSNKGFSWDKTKEDREFWDDVIQFKNFDLFFEKYPKQDYLENYEPKGQLIGFPKEIIARMLDCQEEQGNPRDISVFEKQCIAGTIKNGFFWGQTQEGWDFWHGVIYNKNFDLFFEKYPKQEYQKLKNNKNMQENNKKEEDSQEFRIGDKVIDIITRQRGKIFRIDTNNKSIFIVYVDFNEEKNIYTLDGRLYFNDKYPRLLHYRDDYDYSIIDFNNLPERQEAKRWRAKEGWTYYSFTFDFKVASFYDTRRSLDNKAYESGNYFQTKEEAQEIADKLNEYFQNIIKRIGDTYYSFTSNFEIEDFYDDDDIFDKKAYKLGNYFKTKEEAQEVADKLNKYLQELLNK